MQPWRDRFLLFYMMRVPIIFLVILGVVLPLAFQSSMFHGVADLNLWQVFEAAFLGSLLVSSTITTSFLVLLYGLERADGWKDRPAANERVTTWSILSLYGFGSVCWLRFLWSIFQFMQQAGRVESGLLSGFLLCASFGLLAAMLVVFIFFVIALRLAKPEDDEAMEVFAYPLILVIRRLIGGDWVRSIKNAQLPFARPKSSQPQPRQPWIIRQLVKLGPGYATKATDGNPSVMHSGFRFAGFVVLIFLLCYAYSGQITFWHLRSLDEWSLGGAPNNVLNYLLMFFILWNCLLSGLTFFVDRFRIPALAALGAVLLLISFLGSSDHVFPTVNRPTPAPVLLTPQQWFQLSPDSVVVVAAAGGGIQSAAWTSKVMCGLRADLQAQGFQNSVRAISGVSGGSVGALFYLRCLEPFPPNDPPEIRARDSSLGAVAWGLTHPDLRRIFVPGPATSWASADRGWALERSILKSAHFATPWQRLAEDRPGWPVMLFNSTDALTGDPVVFTNSDFPSAGRTASSATHSLHNFLDQARKENKDVMVTTAARMSAAFPYVSPEARPMDVLGGVHLGDGGYFDNSGVFALSEWLKEAAINSDSLGTQSRGANRRILILQLDAFPDNKPPNQQPTEKWYYQFYSPLNTMLNVRSEGQLVRDEAAGKDLQELLKASGYDTGWMLLRYQPTAVILHDIHFDCPKDPPLSWHLTPVEQRCIDQGWSNIQAKSEAEIARFLKGDLHFEKGECEPGQSGIPPGLYERFCPAISAGPKP